MKTRGIFSKIASVAVVLGFGVFLLFGQLESSDFARGLFGPPNNAHWSNFDSLNLNQVWNYNFNGANSLQSYLDSVGAHGLKSVLRLDPALYDTFYLEYYSDAQRLLYEAELDYQQSSAQLSQGQPEYFYHFLHSTVAEDCTGLVRGEAVPNPWPDQGFSWKYSMNDPDYGAGTVLIGPYETILGEYVLGGYRAQTDWPEYDGSRNYKTILRVMADLTQCSLNDTIFRLQIKKSGNSDLALVYFTKADFGGVSYPNWKSFEVDYEVPDDSTSRGSFKVWYYMRWYDTCDFWVDWIKYMDKERGYWLFYTDSSGNFAYQDSILNVIKTQCREIEIAKGDTLAGWKQSDEPWRSTFRAHGVIYEFLKQQNNPPANLFACP